MCEMSLGDKCYAEARKKDGQMYSKNSRTFRIYEVQCVELIKKQGLAKTEHKLPIADEDIKKSYRCGAINAENPTTLQNKVFFDLMLLFCRRGRQNLSQLKPHRFPSI